MAAFPSGEPRKEKLDLVICKHCKRNIMRLHAREHISGCLKSKQEKARKKKEARDATARAKEKAEKGGDDKDDDLSDSEIKVDSRPNASGARKSTNKTSNGNNNDESTKKSKKRKADAEEDKSEPKKKKNKKDEPKPKPAPKPKGPVDVEKQCGVVLPNGAQCARSLTCKSHSMGAKRAVPGRSLPYDMLLQAYQKKNQARQQSTSIHSSSPTIPTMLTNPSTEAAISANAPALYDSDPEDPSNINGAHIDSDSERDAVMTSLSRNFNPAYLHSAPVYNPSNNGNNPIRGPQPLATHTIFPTRRKYQLVRMKEMLSNALSGNRGGGLFAVQDPNPNHGVQQQSARQGFFPGSTAAGGAVGGGGMMGNDGFAIPSAISVSSTASTTAGDAMAEAQRRAIAAHGGGGSGGGGSLGGQKSTAKRPSIAVAAGAD